MSYLRLVDTMDKGPPNVNGHLWTDRVDEHALRTPFVGPGGTEIEIPHSMLDSAKLRVSVHPKRDLDALIDGAPQPVRTTMRHINGHLLNENVGLRSDVIRQIVATLYRRPGVPGAQRLNMYADRDTLANMAAMRDYCIIRESPSETKPALGNFKDLDEAARARMTRFALGESLKMPRGQPRAIPESIKHAGFACRPKENDAIAAIPGSQTMLTMANNMQLAMDQLRYPGRTGGTSDVQQDNARSELLGLNEDLLTTINYLRTLRRMDKLESLADLTAPEILRAFDLSLRIRAAQPQMEKRIAEIAAQSPSGVEGNASSLDVAAAMKVVFNSYMTLTQNVVNCVSYATQVAEFTTATKVDVDDLFWDVAGGLPRSFQSEKSWIGSLDESINTGAARRLHIDAFTAAHQHMFGLLERRAEPAT
jgi:hypothetical protein